MNNYQNQQTQKKSSNVVIYVLAWFIALTAFWLSRMVWAWTTSAMYECENPGTWDFNRLYGAKANCLSFKNELIKNANDLYESRNDAELAKKKTEIESVNKTMWEIDSLIINQVARPFR